MLKIAILSLVLAAIVTRLWTATSSTGRSAGLTDTAGISNHRREELATTATEASDFSQFSRSNKFFVEGVGVQHSLKEGEKNMFQDVLLFTQNLEEAKVEIEAHGGRITHIFSPDVFVAHIPQFLDISSLQKSESSPQKKLAPTVEAAVEAWKASIKKREAAPSETEGLRWDTPGYQPPGYDD